MNSFFSENRCHQFVQKIKLLSLKDNANLDECCTYLEKIVSHNIIWEKTPNPNKTRLALIEFPFDLYSLIDFERVIQANDKIIHDETFKAFCKFNQVFPSIGSLMDPFGNCDLSFFTRIKDKRIFEFWINDNTHTIDGLEISCTCNFKVHSFIFSKLSLVGKKVDLIGSEYRTLEESVEKTNIPRELVVIDSVMITAQKFQPISSPDYKLKAKFILRGYSAPKNRHFPDYLWVPYDLYL